MWRTRIRMGTLGGFQQLTVNPAVMAAPDEPGRSQRLLDGPKIAPIVLFFEIARQARRR